MIPPVKEGEYRSAGVLAKSSFHAFCASSDGAILYEIKEGEYRSIVKVQ